eukprot:SAG11_NODE_261_length_11530_cov_8.418861_9_plen_169_part_00
MAQLATSSMERNSICARAASYNLVGGMRRPLRLAQPSCSSIGDSFALPASASLAAPHLGAPSTRGFLPQQCKIIIVLRVVRALAQCHHHATIMTRWPGTCFDLLLLGRHRLMRCHTFASFQQRWRVALKYVVQRLQFHERATGPSLRRRGDPKLAGDTSLPICTYATR